jgi:hypothetical protein
MNKISPRRGFFKLLILLIIAVFLLWYFKVDVRGFADSTEGQAIIAKGKDLWYVLWDKILKEPALYLYNFFINTILPTIQSHLLNPSTPTVQGVQ